MKMWKEKGYFIKEIEFNNDLHLFQVIKDDKVIATITPNSIEDMEAIIAYLKTILLLFNLVKKKKKKYS